MNSFEELSTYMEFRKGWLSTAIESRTIRGIDHIDWTPQTSKKSEHRLKTTNVDEVSTLTQQRKRWRKEYIGWSPQKLTYWVHRLNSANLGELSTSIESRKSR